MNKLTWMIAAAMLTAAFAARATSDTPGTGVASDAGAIYEWVDDSGRMHASDTVPEKFRSVAKRIDPNRTRLSAGEQEEAQRQAAALKAKAATAVPVSQTASAGVQPGPARMANLFQPSADTAECAAWRRQVTASPGCFFASSNRKGSMGAMHSCSNEPDPPRPAACAPDGTD
jgi:hypothetical protein